MFCSLLRYFIHFSLSSAAPCLELEDPMDDKLINELAVFLEHKNEQYRLLRQYRVHKGDLQNLHYCTVLVHNRIIFVLLMKMISYIL